MKRNNNDDIEILDFDDDDKSSKKKKKKKKVYSKKALRRMKIFCTISILFALGCCVFYGIRLVKWYKIYNPKVSEDDAKLLGKHLEGNEEIVYEGSGVYRVSGNLIYKGDVKKNYVKYNNLLWRIIRVNSDNSIQLILDESINNINWSKDHTEYTKSNVYEYLNDVFINYLNKDMLAKTYTCSDTVADLSDIKCDKNISSYVTVLDISTFLNSLVDNKSFITDADEQIWLANNNETGAWNVNGTNVSSSELDSLYELRPVITLNERTSNYGGDGTKEKPYIVEKDRKQELMIGDTVKLGNDKWIIYEVNNDNYRLVLNNVLDKTSVYSNDGFKIDVNDKTASVGYLNDTYLNSLSYKDLLKTVSWYNGKNNGSYKDILNDKYEAKVGLLNLYDLKFNNDLDNYYISTYNDEYVYVMGKNIKESGPTITRNIRPCIAISKDSKIKSGNGTINEPFELEA